MKKIIVLFCAFFVCTAAVFAGAGDSVSQLSLLKKFKDVSHNLSVQYKMKNKAKALTNDEKAVIKKYVSGAVRGEDTFLLINCNLNNSLGKYIPKKEITKPLKCRLDYYAEQLTVPIAKTKLPQNIILYKGISDKDINHIFESKRINDYINRPVNEENLKFVKQKLEGDIITENGFMLTSYDINNTAQTKFIFEINAPKNLQAVLIEELDKKYSKQVLVNKDSKWQVTDVTLEKSKKTSKMFYRVKVKFVK